MTMGMLFILLLYGFQIFSYIIVFNFSLVNYDYYTANYSLLTVQ